MENDNNMKKLLRGKYPLAVHPDDASNCRQRSGPSASTTGNRPTNGSGDGRYTLRRRWEAQTEPRAKSKESCKMFPFTSLWRKVGG